MRKHAFLGLLTLLLISGQVQAAIVNVYIGGTITFNEEAFRNPALPQSVVDSVLDLLPDGSNLSVKLVVDTETPDASPDPDVGNYQGAVTQASFLVNGFNFPLDTGTCNPDSSCNIRVENDTTAIPGGMLDRISITAPVLPSQELGTAVSNASGVVPRIDRNPGIPVKPVISGYFGMFDLDFDLVDSNALFDPLTAPFDQGVFSLFISNLWVPSNTGEVTVIDFNVNSLQISGEPPAVVPVPPAFWLFSLALLGLLGVNKRRKTI